MTTAEEYEQARNAAHKLCAELLYRPWYLYILRPLQTLALVQAYLAADKTAWIKMYGYMETLAAKPLIAKPTEPA